MDITTRVTLDHLRINVVARRFRRCIDVRNEGHNRTTSTVRCWNRSPHECMFVLVSILDTHRCQLLLQDCSEFALRRCAGIAITFGVSRRTDANIAKKPLEKTPAIDDD